MCAEYSSDDSISEVLYEEDIDSDCTEYDEQGLPYQRFRKPSILVVDAYIPVQTIYVSYGKYRVPNEKYVRDQFEIFGSIEKIKIVYKAICICFIQFKKDYHATR